ncbi:MAG: ABC transporter permease subunit [Myxococcota bacterium]|nr:ABC transporter substrate-binding protein/permease [Myxococcota bacterium]
MLAPALLAVALLTAPASTDTLSVIKARGYFIWGGDLEGGGPFMWPDEAAPRGLAGVEAELAEMLAQELSRATGTTIVPRFFQGQWDTLPSILGTGRIDMVMNGYEWTPERVAVVDSTIPYYVYELQLIVPEGSPIASWDQLHGGPRKQIGVLGGSSSETYIRQHFTASEVQPVLYDGNVNAMSDTAAGKLDATVQDLPIATFYHKDFPKLRFVDKPVEPGRYVILVRKGDDGLREVLDAAIVSLRQRGALRALYERYDMWNATQENPTLLQLPKLEATRADDSPVRAFVAKHGKLLLAAAGTTILLSVTAMPLAIFIGMFIAVTRLYGPRAFVIPATIYVEVIRGTPLMLQLFFIFFLLPAVGINISALPAAIIGLAVNYSAYEAEIYRAGLQAVPVGQMEAALTLGMSRGQALRRIVLPQAARMVMPPVTNDFIALFKDTSVCSVITVVELSKRYNIAVMNNPKDILPLAAVTALLYLGMSYPLSLLSTRMEHRLRR